MQIISKHKNSLICCIGDIHGCFDVMVSKIKDYDLTDCICLQLGDFGVGFNYNDPRAPIKEKKRLSMLNSFLKHRNIFLYAIRGNHDSVSFFDGKHNFSNLIFMEDYDVIEVGDRRILGVGGAISVDRRENKNRVDGLNGKWYPGRRIGIDYWENEVFNFDEKKIRDISGVNIVITHTAPDFAYPNNYNNIKIWIDNPKDPTLLDELIIERKQMSQMYDILDEKNLILNFVYGHFHMSKIEMHRTTNFHLLDVCEFREIR